jgi:hypothetical protein
MSSVDQVGGPNSTSIIVSMSTLSVNAMGGAHVTLSSTSSFERKIIAGDDGTQNVGERENSMGK